MTVNTTVKERPDRKMAWWIAWTATLVTFIIGGGVARLVAGPVLGPLSGLLAGLLAGAVIGFGQWLVLRAHFPVTALWVGATALGVAAGVAAGAALVSYEVGPADLAAMGLVAGISTGALQAWVIRDQAPGAWRWLLVNPPLWAVSWLVTWAIGLDTSLHWAVFGASGALVYTIVAGLVLRRLLAAHTPARDFAEAAHLRASR